MSVLAFEFDSLFGGGHGGAGHKRFKLDCVGHRLLGRAVLLPTNMFQWYNETKRNI